MSSSDNFDQALEHLGCHDVQCIIPLRSLRKNAPELEAKVLAHVETCERCRELETIFDPAAPVPEECRKAREMAPKVVMEEERTPADIEWYRGHVRGCPVCFKRINTSEILALLPQMSVWVRRSEQT